MVETLLTQGHDVTVFDQNRYAAMETSFANGGQLSASNAEVWTQWGTVLKGGGRQSPHMHPLGWLSGVYYVDLPADMQADAANAGWLEFGAPPDRYYCSDPPATQSYAPAAGRLILFPSWFWHRTLPFGSSAARISIAFDVMPDFADR